MGLRAGISTVQSSHSARISALPSVAISRDRYSHQSVAIQYAVNCAERTSSLVAWRMFSGPRGEGILIWSGRHAAGTGDAGQSPVSDEERGALATACQSTAAAR